MGATCCAPKDLQTPETPARVETKPLKEWSADEVKATLKIFKDFDKDKSGKIEQGELQALCEAIGIEASMGEADTLVKDGKIDAKEFFAWYTGCTAVEAATAFAMHAGVFAEFVSGKKQLKEWSTDAVKDVLLVMEKFDKDKNGKIDAAELKTLCETLGIDAAVSEADTLTKDGLIDKREFFQWYVGCNTDEAATVFEDNNVLFA